jgi:hypothetical protein
VCDAGGSNGYAGNGWKAGLADLAAETGMDITVAHFPPGTSKWNKIEHRLFCQISLAWRGRPLTSYDVIINTIGALTTSTGLTAAAVLDQNTCPTGREVSDKQMKDIEDRCLTRHDFHGEWNYTLSPRPAPRRAAPATPPGPDLHALAGPAITGISREDLAALAAALQIPWAAAREQRLYQDRGGPRRHSSGPSGPRRFPLHACLLAAVYRYQLGMTCRAIAGLFGTGHSVISIATRHIASLLAGTGLTLPRPDTDITPA